MKKFFIMLLFGLVLFPSIVLAQESSKNENEIVAQDVKYYKTVTRKAFAVNTYSTDYSNSVTYEISEQEYENINVASINSATVETTYKKMTTNIISQGKYYQYQVVLEWKNMPSTRSYDIIAIGFPSSVRASGKCLFQNSYCLSSGGCYTLTNYNLYLGGNGVGATFALPTGSLSSLKQTLTVNMEKTNPNVTITSQTAGGDYAHATSTVSLATAQKYTVSVNGISHTGDTSQYYDSINVAKATWSGNW